MQLPSLAPFLRGFPLEMSKLTGKMMSLLVLTFIASARFRCRLRARRSIDLAKYIFIIGFRGFASKSKQKIPNTTLQLSVAAQSPAGFFDFALNYLH